MKGGYAVYKSFYTINLPITNCYLLKCFEGYLLIDTGYLNSYKKFLKKLKRLKIDINEIKYLLLTHHHDDHAGFASKLVDETHCKIIVHNNAILPLRNGESEDSMVPLNKNTEFFFSLFKSFHKKFKFPAVNIIDSDLIIYGDDKKTLQEIGIDGEILYTPGHTKDSISVLLSDGNAFVGDTAMSLFNILGCQYRPIYLESLEETYRSWDKLHKASARTLYPSHGKPFNINKLKRQ
jgi:glyoxylase-like metal-dependent hydrolase (beta-lactamase superfamily II)